MGQQILETHLLLMNWSQVSIPFHDSKWVWLESEVRFVRRSVCKESKRIALRRRMCSIVTRPYHSNAQGKRFESFPFHLSFRSGYIIHVLTTNPAGRCSTGEQKKIEMRPVEEFGMMGEIQRFQVLGGSVQSAYSFWSFPPLPQTFQRPTIRTRGSTC